MLEKAGIQSSTSCFACSSRLRHVPPPLSPSPHSFLSFSSFVFFSFRLLLFLSSPFSLLFPSLNSLSHHVLFLLFVSPHSSSLSSSSSFSSPSSSSPRYPYLSSFSFSSSHSFPPSLSPPHSSSRTPHLFSYSLSLSLSLFPYRKVPSNKDVIARESLAPENAENASFSTAEKADSQQNFTARRTAPHTRAENTRAHSKKRPHLRNRKPAANAAGGPGRHVKNQCGRDSSSFNFFQVLAQPALPALFSHV